jgi:hypothetical protein
MHTLLGEALHLLDALSSLPPRGANTSPAILGFGKPLEADPRRKQDWILKCLRGGRASFYRGLRSNDALLLPTALDHRNPWLGFDGYQLLPAEGDERTEMLSISDSKRLLVQSTRASQLGLQAWFEGERERVPFLVSCAHCMLLTLCETGEAAQEGGGRRGGGGGGVHGGGGEVVGV